MKFLNGWICIDYNSEANWNKRRYKEVHKWIVNSFEHDLASLFYLFNFFFFFWLYVYMFCFFWGGGGKLELILLQSCA